MKKIQQLIPILSIYVMALALLKVYIYYNNFNIPIKYFMTISELTINIFEDLIYIFPPLVILYFFTEKAEPKIDLTETKNKISDSLSLNFKNKNWKEIIRLLLKRIWAWIILICFLLLFIGFPLYLILFGKNYTDKIGGFAFLGGIIILFLLITKVERLITFLTIDGLILSTIIFLLTWFFVIKILSDIQNTENGKFVGTKVITEDSTYISTQDHYYIGQTSTYIFLFDKTLNKPTIIPASKIKRIDLAIKNK